MSFVALTAFVTVKDKDGNAQHYFQNGKQGSTPAERTVSGHSYLSFMYQGAAMNRSGDNLEASIILANSPLSMSYVKDFVEKKYYIQVETFLMTSDFDKDTSALKLGFDGIFPSRESFPYLMLSHLGCQQPKHQEGNNLAKMVGTLRNTSHG